MRTCQKCNGTGQVEDFAETGMAFRRQREAAEVTQTAMAKAMGYHQAYLCELEHGYRNWTQKMKRKYAETLEQILEARKIEQAKTDSQSGENPAA